MSLSAAKSMGYSGESQGFCASFGAGFWVGDPKKGKREDRSPSPRVLYEPCGRSQPFKTLFSPSNTSKPQIIVTSLMGVVVENRATGKRDSVTACDIKRCSENTLPYLSIYLIILNIIYIYYRHCHTVPSILREIHYVKNEKGECKHRSKNPFHFSRLKTVVLSWRSVTVNFRLKNTTKQTILICYAITACNTRKNMT